MHHGFGHQKNSDLIVELGYWAFRSPNWAVAVRLNRNFLYQGPMYMRGTRKAPDGPEIPVCGASGRVKTKDTIG